MMSVHKRAYRRIANEEDLLTPGVLTSANILEDLCVTSGGINYWPQLRMAHCVLSPERAMQATDYPFEDQGEAVGFVKAMTLAARGKKALFEYVAVRVFGLSGIRRGKWTPHRTRR